MSITGDRIRMLREERGMRQGDVARQVGCTGQVISNIERGYTNAKQSLISRLAEFFHVPAGYLLGNTDDRWIEDNETSDAALVSSRIREQMESTGKTEEDIKKATGLSDEECSAVLSGAERPSSSILSRLAGELGTTSDYLIGRSPYPVAISTEEEQDIILYYRSMSKRNKRIFMGMLEEMMEDSNILRSYSHQT